MSFARVNAWMVIAGATTLACQQIGLPAATPVRDGRGPGVPREAPPPAPKPEKKDEPEAPAPPPLIAHVPVASELAESVTALTKELTGAPAPGLVHLRDLDPRYEKFDGKIEHDALAALREQKKSAYDFRYVRLGVKGYDEFLQQAAEHYAIAFQAKELDARLRWAAAKLLREGVDAKSPTDEVVARAMDEGGFKGREELEVLVEVDRINMENARKAVKRTPKLLDTGKKLSAAAPRTLKQPKETRERIVAYLNQSVKLVEEAGGMLESVVR